MKNEWGGESVGEILIIDDTPASLQQLHRILSEGGHRVRSAAGGQLGLDAVAGKAPDLILLAIRMPEMDGFEVCRRLKAQELSREIPVIFVTVADDDVDKAEGFRLGGVDYITKPFEASEALARVKTHLTVRTTQIALEAAERQLRTVRDFNERKPADQQLQAHLHFLECMERVNRVIQRTSDPEQMMSDVLDEVLAIFDCDRAWLVYPCDPDAPSWAVPMERTRPEWPGAFALGAVIPMKPELSELFHLALSSEGPMKLGPGSEPPLPPEASARFQYQAALQIAVYPKTGAPWLFGLHQCSYRRMWTAEEEQLFQAIGQRIGDGLSILLTLRDLRESEERFRSLVEQAADAISVHDLDGRIVEVNSRLCDSLGYTRDELLGMTVSDIDRYIILDDHPRRYWESLPLKQTAFFETRHTRKDESNFPVEVHLGLVEMHGRRLILASARDITERKQAEEALLSEKLLSENYINSLPGLFYVFDEQRFVRWNEAWKEVTGYSADELATKYGTDFFDEADSKLIKERMEKGFREGSAEAEADLVTKDGRRIPYYFTGLRREFNGKPYLVGLGIEITDRKRAEEERRELEAQLRQAQKLEAVGQLAGGGGTRLQQPAYRDPGQRRAEYGRLAERVGSRS